MNIAIAVGLITAGSTLAGGLVASITALKIQSKQLREQSVLAREERAERQAVQRRALQREAYARFIGVFEELDTLFSDCWDRVPKVRSDSGPLPEITRYVTGKIRAIRDALDSLNSSINIIVLEGPVDVESAARKVCFVFAQECIKMELVLVGKLHPEESTADLEDYGPEESHMSRYAAKAAFIEAARTALEPTED